MKPTGFALLLLAVLAFVLAGCSDNSTAPVSPTDQPAASPSLHKVAQYTAEFSLSSPKEFVGGGGRMWENATQLLAKEFEIHEPFTSSDPNLGGEMTNFLSLRVDQVSGEGTCHGAFTVPAAGGVWEGTYEGYRSKTDVPYIFTLPLKGVAHGKGGTIDKWKYSFEITLTVFTDLSGIVRPDIPLQAPIWWQGTGSALITEH